MSNALVAIGRLGWIFAPEPLQLEAGMKLFLPATLGPTGGFYLYERGGGETPWGLQYGGDRLQRVVSLYLQGSL